MNDSSSSLILAVDGGGTRCRIAVSDGQSTTGVEAGSANVSSDFDGALRTILHGLQELAHKAGIEMDRLKDVPAFMGLAGVTGPQMSDRVRRALPFTHVDVADDRPAALRGALGTHDGAVAHCGTGSFFAGQAEGRMRFAGGWGPVLGDEASAQWLGTKALGLTLQCLDGRVAASPLSERLLADFDGGAGIVRFAGTATPAQLGTLAPLVTEGAQTGDPLAMRIMQSGARYICESLPAVGWKAGMRICLTGGLGPCYAPFLPADMASGLADPEGQPLAGALALARDFAQEVAHGSR